MRTDGRTEGAKRGPTEGSYFPSVPVAADKSTDLLTRITRPTRMTPGSSLARIAAYSAFLLTLNSALVSSIVRKSSTSTPLHHLPLKGVS